MVFCALMVGSAVPGAGKGPFSFSASLWDAGSCASAKTDLGGCADAKAEGGGEACDTPTRPCMLLPVAFLPSPPTQRCKSPAIRFRTHRIPH